VGKVGNAIAKPFKELGQEVVKVSTTIGSGGTVRYDEDQGFKEGFVTKTVAKEAGNIVGNAMSLVQNNPALTDAAGMYFGVPNASEFLNRKEVEKPATPSQGPIVVEQLQPPKNNNMIIYIGGAIAAITIFFLMRKK